ncbi:MAG: hypothetical protein F4X39_02495 [Acidobacteriia bacterium]|nr:hypothetical protein [Terriglobia bacterium]
MYRQPRLPPPSEILGLRPRVHAAPGGKAEALARKLAESGKPLLTLDSPANANLMEMGAWVLRKVADHMV